MVSTARGPDTSTPLSLTFAFTPFPDSFIDCLLSVIVVWQKLGLPSSLNRCQHSHCSTVT